MEPKLVSEHLHTELTRLPIRRPPLREDPTGGLQNAAEGPWSRLSLTVSLSSLHERGSDEGKRNMQAEDHASSSKQDAVLTDRRRNIFVVPYFACPRSRGGQLVS